MGAAVVLVVTFVVVEGEVEAGMEEEEEGSSGVLTPSKERRSTM